MYHWISHYYTNMTNLQYLFKINIREISNAKFIMSLVFNVATTELICLIGFYVFIVNGIT